MSENKVKPLLPVSLKAANGKATDRRVWSIPLHGVLVPFFTATNAIGETHIPAEALGCPLRLAQEKDGTPRFSSARRPMVRVVKDIADQVRIMRENFVAGLMGYTETVIKAMPDAYKAQVEAAIQKGRPVANKDADDLADYRAAQQKAALPAETPAQTPEKVMAAA